MHQLDAQLPARVAIPPPVLASAMILAVAVVGFASGSGFAAGVAALVAAAFGIALLTRPDVAAIVLVGVVPAVSGLRRGLPVSGLRAGELLVVVLAGSILLVHALSGAQAIRWGPVEWALTAYAAGTIALGVAAVARSDGSYDDETIGSLVGPVQYLLLYRAVAVAIHTPEMRRRSLYVLLLASAPVAGLAVLQYVDAFGVQRVLETLTASASFSENAELFEERATGPFEHWHVLAGYLLPVLLVGVAILAAGARAPWPRWLVGIVIAVALAGFTLTLTLAAFGGLLLGGAIIAAFGRRLGSFLRWTTIAALVVVAAFGPFLAGRLDEQFEARGGEERSALVPSTIQYRLDVWNDQYTPALEGRWFTGYGPAPPPQVTWQYTESTYLELVLRGGVILLVIYAALIATVLSAAWRAAWDADVTRSTTARAVFATAVVMVPMQAVFPYFLGVGVTHVFWALAALAIGGHAVRHAPPNEREFEG